MREPDILIIGAMIGGSALAYALKDSGLRIHVLERRGSATRAGKNLRRSLAPKWKPERVEYCVSKAALSMWLRALTVRLAPEGIGVFEVYPGIIRTGMTAGVAVRYDGLIADGRVPARRWGGPEDVAKAVAAFARLGLAFATDTIAHVDGALAVSQF